MSRLIILRGLPASGKSTWAKRWVADPTATTPRLIVSMDEIRFAYTGIPQHKQELYEAGLGGRFEKLVASAARTMIANALDDGWDVVADAQHVRKEYLQETIRLAENHNATWEIRDFDEPLPVLIERNRNRPVERQVPLDYLTASWTAYRSGER